MYTPKFIDPAPTYIGYDLSVHPMRVYTLPYNSIYFLTEESTKELSLLLEDRFPSEIWQQNAMIYGGTFLQSQPNWMIRFKNGNRDEYSRPYIAGVLADAYFNHGYPESYAMQAMMNDILSNFV